MANRTARFVSFDCCFMRSIKSKTSRPLRVVCPPLIFRALMWISASVVFCAQSPAQLADSLQIEPELEERFEVNWGADDSTKVNAITSEVELSGNAFVAMDDIRLEAYRIIYSPQKNQACAYGTRDSLGDWIGRPVMTQGGQTFKQDELCFDLESRRGLSRQAVTSKARPFFTPKSQNVNPISASMWPMPNSPRAMPITRIFTFT